MHHTYRSRRAAYLSECFSWWYTQNSHRWLYCTSKLWGHSTLPYLRNRRANDVVTRVLMPTMYLWVNPSPHGCISTRGNPCTIFNQKAPLHLSVQDSRLGANGVRCKEVPLYFSVLSPLFVSICCLYNCLYTLSMVLPAICSSSHPEPYWNQRSRQYQVRK